MRSKAIAILMVAGMLLAGFTGCSGKTDAEAETSTFMGQVTAIDNNTISLAIGEQTKTSGSAKQDASVNAASTSSSATDTQPAAPPDGSGNSAPGAHDGNSGTPPARPDGQTSGAAMGTAPQSGGPPPSGQAPSTGGRTQGTSGQALTVDNAHSRASTSGGLTLTGKTKEIKVADATTIMVDNAGKTTKATLSDITVGSILSVTMTGSTVTEIIIASAQSSVSSTQSAQ